MSTSTPASSPPQTVIPRPSRLVRLLLGIEAYVEWTFIMFSVYALSIGPLYWQWVDAKYGSGTLLLAAIYEPLWILGNHFPSLGNWLNWYVHWWVF